MAVNIAYSTAVTPTADQKPTLVPNIPSRSIPSHTLHQPRWGVIDLVIGRNRLHQLALIAGVTTSV